MVTNLNKKMLGLLLLLQSAGAGDPAAARAKVCTKAAPCDLRIIRRPTHGTQGREDHAARFSVDTAWSIDYESVLEPGGCTAST